MGCGAQTEDEDVLKQELSRVSVYISQLIEAYKAEAARAQQVQAQLSELRDADRKVEQALKYQNQQQEKAVADVYTMLQGSIDRSEANAREILNLKTLFLQLRSDYKKAVPTLFGKYPEVDVYIDFDFEAQEKRIASLSSEIQKLNKHLEQTDYQVRQNEILADSAQKEAHSAIEMVTAQNYNIATALTQNMDNQRLLRAVQTQNSHIQDSIAADHQRMLVIQDAGKMTREQTGSLYESVAQLQTDVADVKFIVRGFAKTYRRDGKGARLDAAGCICEVDSLSDDCGNIRMVSERVGNKMK